MQLRPVRFAERIRSVGSVEFLCCRRNHHLRQRTCRQFFSNFHEFGFFHRDAYLVCFGGSDDGPVSLYIQKE